MNYVIRSYTGSLKCKIDGHTAKSIFKSDIGHFRPHRTSIEKVYHIDKDVGFEISPSFVLYLWKNDLIFEN
jgi:hypothetical protein